MNTDADSFGWGELVQSIPTAYKGNTYILFENKMLAGEDLQQQEHTTWTDDTRMIESAYNILKK